MWALELCAVATSDNRQQWHRHSRWTRLMPSPIAMDPINAIIVRRQDAHEKSPLNATRKAVAISLEATRRPCWWTQQGHREGIASITTILIPRQRISPQERQSTQSVRDECKLQHFADQRRSQGSYAQRNDGNYRHRQHGRREQLQQLANSNQTTTKTKPSWHVRHASRARQLLDKQQIESPGRAGDTVFNDERTSASNNNKKWGWLCTLIEIVQSGFLDGVLGFLVQK